MQQVTMDAKVREGVGKEKNRKLRQHGEVPAILYGHAMEPLALTVAVKDVLKALSTPSGQNVLVDLNVTNGKTRKYTAMIQEVQRDQLGKVLHHVDFHSVNLTEKVHANVKVVLKGHAAGEKNGGNVEHVLREVPVEGLVTDVPPQIDVDISHLQLSDTIHVKDLQVPKGVTIRAEPEDLVVIVHPPRTAEAAETAPAAEAAAAPVAAKE